MRDTITVSILAGVALVAAVIVDVATGAVPGFLESATLLLVGAAAGVASPTKKAANTDDSDALG